MKKSILGVLAAALLLGACSTGGLTPANVATDLVCKDGVSVSEVLKEQQQATAGELTIAVSKVVTGAKATTFLASKGVVGDGVAVLSAVDVKLNQPTAMSLVLALKEGCVVGQKFMKNDELTAQLAMGDGGMVTPSVYLPAATTQIIINN